MTTSSSSVALVTGASPGIGEAIARRVVAGAVSARRPGTRYVAGKLAAPMMLVRRWLGDRVFDRAVMSAVD